MIDILDRLAVLLKSIEDDEYCSDLTVYAFPEYRNLSDPFSNSETVYLVASYVWLNAKIMVILDGEDYRHLHYLNFDYFYSPIEY